MSPEIITGIWEGFYTYGPEYPEALQQTQFHFIMKLHVEDGIIHGTCEDQLTREYFHGQPATVEGTLVDGELSLIKRYPHYLGMNEQEETYVDWARPGEGIHFVGTITRKWFSRNHFAQGNWDISGSFLDESGNALYYTSTGDWEMRKGK